jgi:site-specific DNA-methyltransferase (adenine-specific)
MITDLILDDGSSPSPLVRLETARRLLAEVRGVDDARAIRDVAEAARIYARQARLGLEAQNDAAEIKLRAERKLGELLAQSERNPGGNTNRSQPATGSPDEPARLRDLGISKSQSSRWQAIAAVPETVFDRHMADVREQGRRDGKTELTSAGAILLARQYRSNQPRTPAPTLVLDQPDSGDCFEVADAAALPWADGSVDLTVTSPPYALDLPYAGGDVPDYLAWLQVLRIWLAELLRVANQDWGRLCLNVPLDRDLGGWQPVSADALYIARSVGWQFRTWILWDKGQAGAGTDRGSIDSAGAPNVTAPVESVLAFYRGQWKRSGPAFMPHEAWLELCGPRGLWRFPGTSDPLCPAPFPEQLPERCITLFSFPGNVVADPFVGRGTTAALTARLGRVVWASDRDPACVLAARAWAARERAAQRYEPDSGSANHICSSLSHRSGVQPQERT